MIWNRRVTQLCTMTMGALLSLVVAHAAMADPALLPPESEFERWGKLVERVGFCLVGFGILGYMLYRQSALENITKRYDDTQQAHLQAFKDINEAYRGMAREMKDTMLLAVQVQTTLVARVESMERHHGK